jgi:hypothetical protein
VVQASLGTKQDSTSKIPRAKRAGGVTQAVECLSSKHEVLSSNTRISKKNFLDLINTFDKVTGYKINIPKIVSFLYTITRKKSGK